MGHAGPRGVDEMLRDVPFLQLLRASLHGSARCAAVAFVGSEPQCADVTMSELQALSELQVLANRPQPRENTPNTLLEQTREEKQRLLEKIKHENRALNAAKEQDLGAH
jgi:hypothetical protein